MKGCLKILQPLKGHQQAKFFGVEYIGIGTLPRELRESEATTDNTPKASIDRSPAEENLKLLYHNHALGIFLLRRRFKGYGHYPQRDRS